MYTGCKQFSNISTEQLLIEPIPELQKQSCYLYEKLKTLLRYGIWGAVGIAVL